MVRVTARRNVGWLTGLLLLWALPLVGQISLDGLTVRMTGDVSAGYSGDYGTVGGSSFDDHAQSLNGEANAEGYFYNPSFLSFSVSPFYERSQANSESQSVTAGSGYGAAVNLFGGSRFPGSIYTGENWNSSGIFGIPGETGLTTVGSNRNWGIGWSALIPGLPAITAGYASGTGTSSLLGVAGQAVSTSHTFTVNSGYDLLGINLRGQFIHVSNHTNPGILLTGLTPQIGNYSSNTFELTGIRRVPFLRSPLTVSYSRSTYETSTEGLGSSHGTSQSASTGASFNLVLPLSVNVQYSDNLYGQFLELQNSNGQPLINTIISPTSRMLNTSLYTYHSLFAGIKAAASVVHSEEWGAGPATGLTAVSFTATYGFARGIKGLMINVGAVDYATSSSNSGAVLIGGASYNHKIAQWNIGAYANYYQNLDTVGGIATQSSTTYGAHLERRLHNKMYIRFGGSGGRSVFEEVSGNAGQSEGVNASVTWKLIGASVDYETSDGTTVSTSTGLSTTPLPPSQVSGLVKFNGSSEGYSVNASPFRGMTITGSYSTSNNSYVNASGPFSTDQSIVIGQLSYVYRKLNFVSGYTKTHQIVSSAANPPGTTTSYFFGISRWLKFF